MGSAKPDSIWEYLTLRVMSLPASVVSHVSASVVSHVFKCGDTEFCAEVKEC